jgi:hypothetical protein
VVPTPPKRPEETTTATAMHCGRWGEGACVSRGIGCSCSAASPRMARTARFAALAPVRQSKAWHVD